MYRRWQPPIESLVCHHPNWRMKWYVVRIFCLSKKIRPPLVIIHGLTPQVFFKGSNNYFCMSVNLWMISCTEFKSGSHFFKQRLPKQTHEDAVMIWKNYLQNSMMPTNFSDEICDNSWDKKLWLHSYKSGHNLWIDRWPP